MILGNFIFNYAVNQALAKNHPTKDYEHCLNRHQIKHKCTVCEDVCPAHVYSGAGNRNADFTDCMNCNLCVTACPARCIASSAMNVSAYLKALKAPEKTVYIASRQYEGAAHLKVDYFAALSWEYLACIGLHKKTVFLTEGMAEITFREEKVWKKTVANLEYFFGKEEFCKRFVFSQRPGKEDGLEISRRELFKKANQELKSRISSFVPSESMMDGLLYRYLLKGILEKGSQGDSFGWVIPIINSKCRGCGVCARLCPQEAVSVKKEGGQFQVLFYPFRCNHCGLCRKICIHNAIDGFGVAQISSLRPMILHESTADGSA